MLGSFPWALAAGAVFGFLSGLGIGGGSLLMLWLTWAAGMDAATARCVNLLFFIPASLCACFLRWKQGSLPLRKLLLPMALGCLSAAGFSFLAGKLETTLLQKLLGVLLVITGLRELFYRRQKLR